MKRAGRWLFYGLADLLALIVLAFAVGDYRSPDVTARASVEIARPPAEVW